MFVLRMLPVILVIQLAWSLTAIEERFLMNEIMDNFEDVLTVTSIEIDIKSQKKREASEVSSVAEKSAGLLNSGVKSRQSHYWTRKRGPDSIDSSTFYPFTLYPPKKSFINSRTDDYTNKERVKREADETEDEQAAEEADEQADKTEDQGEDVKTQSSRPRGRNSGNERRMGGKFGQKFNKCCGEEAEAHGRNGTLFSLKFQCSRELRKNRKNFTAPDDQVEGNGGLYSMFSCNRISQWKTVVTCTMDCVAMKIGVIDSNGVVNVDVAKRVVRENAAKQKWEQYASDDLVEKCAKDVAASQSKLIDAFGYQCNSKASEFVYCMWRELFLTCPADKQTKSKQCEKLRTVLTKHSENKFKN